MYTGAGRSRIFDRGRGGGDHQYYKLTTKASGKCVPADNFSVIWVWTINGDPPLDPSL